MRTCVFCAAVAISTASATAQTTLAEWTFETSIPATAGPHAAEGGVNAGAGSPALGFHTDPGVVYSNPAGNGSPESFSANFWSIGDYYEFRTGTAGYESITIGWDQTRSGTGPGTFDLQWSLDGTNYTTLTPGYTVLGNTNPPGFWNATTPFPEYVFAPVAGPAALDDQPLVYFRLTNTVAPGGTTGTNRVDNVRIAGTRIAGTCYPDCNLDLALTIADFGCFQTKFVAGDPYADCNGVGGLTIADFGCFQTAFVAGCP